MYILKVDYTYDDKLYYYTQTGYFLGKRFSLDYFGVDVVQFSPRILREVVNYDDMYTEQKLRMTYEFLRFDAKF